MALGQYLKDTQAELRHVAWPTRTQTIVFTVLVALVSIFVAAYLSVFDFAFTSSLAKYLQTMPSTPAQTQTNASSSPIQIEISTTTNQ